MDHGLFRTYVSGETMTVQIGIGAEGGAGTPVPDLSIELDDLDQALECVEAAGIGVECGPTSEPWGGAGSLSVIRWVRSSISCSTKRLPRRWSDACGMRPLPRVV